MEVIRTIDSDQAFTEAAKLLHRYFLHVADRPTLFLVSGGSAFLVLKKMNDEILRLNLSIGLVDERWTKKPEDLNANAFKKLSFYTNSQKRGVPFVPIEVGASSLEESAQQYEAYLKNWRSVFREGVIVSLLGIGADGHIAGIMPYPQDREWFEDTFMQSKRWVVGYNTRGVGNFPDRVSVSLHFLLQEVDRTVVCACGEAKKAALERLAAIDGTVSETPARILIPMKDVYLYTDAI